MELGNREYQIEEMAETYEFQIAFDSFNQMMNSIENLRLENMKKELEKKKLELNNLQLQIRPHFLLNTFNLVYMLCTKNEVGSIQKLMLYLACLLYTSSKELIDTGMEGPVVLGITKSLTQAGKELADANAKLEAAKKELEKAKKDQEAALAAAKAEAEKAVKEAEAKVAAAEAKLAKVQFSNTKTSIKAVKSTKKKQVKEMCIRDRMGGGPRV